MTQLRAATTATACALVAALILAGPAMAGTGRGTFTLARQAGAFTPAAQARWALDGAVLPARAEAPLVGLRADPSLTNTDSRYVRATLQSAQQDPVVNDCGDGMGGTTTQTFGGVASAPSVFEVALSLNLLTGKGKAQVGVAETPWAGAEGRDFAPGMTTYTLHSTCYGSVQDSSSPVEVVRDGEQAMFTAFAASRLESLLSWRLRRGAGGAWHMAGARTLKIDDTYTVTTSLSFAGSPVSLHAGCTMPTVRDLARARTLAAAKRITARAGFPHVLSRGSRKTRAARRGRYFIDEGIGNTGPVPCGSRGLHLVRSLGWP
jgi:hypothetical protein